MPFHPESDELKKLNNIFDARSKMEPIKVLPNIIRQVPALAKELFQLQKRSHQDYYFLPITKEETILPIPDGIFHFVIFTTDPCTVFCGLKRSQPNVRRIGGHASISKGDPVYMAGDFTLKRGELLSWNSGSGHYRPQGKHVRNNLLPPAQLLLPSHLYKSYWE